MAVISITTTQNIELEYELASLGERIVACIIDLVIIIGYTIIISLFTNTMRNQLWLILLFYFPAIFYSLISELTLNGQTVGKRVMSIKVVSLNGNQPSLGQYLIRWLFRLVDIWIGSGVFATVAVAVTQKQQRIGDLVAGTTLVRTRPKSTIEQTIYTPVVNVNYQASYPEVTNLTDKDVQLIKEVITAVQKTGNTMLAIAAKEKIESLLNIKSHHFESIDFLYTLLNDYNYLTGKT